MRDVGNARPAAVRILPVTPARRGPHRTYVSDPGAPGARHPPPRRSRVNCARPARARDTRPRRRGRMAGRIGTPLVSSGSEGRAAERSREAPQASVLAEAAADGGGVEVEGSGDLADGLAFAHELAGERLLVVAHLAGASEGHAARHGGAPAVVGAAVEETTLELGDAGEHGEDPRPAGLVVSAHGSSSDRGPASFPLMRSAMASGSLVERASRSRRVTTSTSPRRSLSMSSSSLGRSRRAPDIFSSNKSSQPASSRRRRCSSRA